MTDIAIPKKLEVARIRVCFFEPFFGSLLYGTECVAFDEQTEAAMKAMGMSATMATDGKLIYYSREWVEARTVEELMGVLIHEIWHIVLGHHLRHDILCSRLDIEDQSDKFSSSRKWNYATDYVINPLTLDDGHVLPEGALIDNKYRGKSAEQVYAELEDDKGGGKGSGGKGDWGQVLCPDGMDDSAAREEKDRVETAVRQAAMAAKSRGKLPGNVEEMIKEWDEAKVDWRSRLWRAVDSTGGNFEDISWSRPNRRYLPHDIFVPSPEFFGPGTVVCAVDTSGSVSNEELKAFSSEMNAIIADTKPDRTILIECDAVIHGEPKVFEEGEEFPTQHKYRGRGGTSFEPPFRWLKENDIRPNYMVYLTDGECSWPKDPGFPVIWVLTGKMKAPFGTSINIKV